MPKKALTKTANADKAVELYNGQVLVKFYEPKHTYHVAIPKGYVEIKDRGEEKVIEFDKSRKEFTHIKSITQRTKNIFWKEKLAGWMIKVSLESMCNQLIPGTKITKDMLAAAAKKASGARYTYLDKAGDIGTKVHEFLHDYGKTGKPVFSNDPQVKKASLELMSWIEEFNVEFIENEFILYNPKYDCIGTTDAIMKHRNSENEIVVGTMDGKTGSYVYPEAYKQIAFYGETYGLMTGDYSDENVILWLPKQPQDDRSFVPVTKYPDMKCPFPPLDHQADLLAFECALYLDRWHYETKGFE